MDESLTVPCGGVGVWEGAQVVVTATYYKARVGIVTQQAKQGGIPGLWDVFLPGAGDLGAWVSVSADRLALDLTHGPTRMWSMVRLSERLGFPGIAMMRHYEGAWWVEYIDGTAQQAECSELADIDATDSACLPNGAPLSHVRALAVVLRHVYTEPTEADTCEPSDDDDDSSCDDDRPAPAPPWTPFDELLASRNDATVKEWEAADEAARAERRAWLDENNGWPPR